MLRDASFRDTSLSTKCRVGQKPCHNYPGPARPDGNNPAADAGVPAEEEAQCVECCDEQEDSSGNGVEGFLGHEGYYRVNRVSNEQVPQGYSGSLGRSKRGCAGRR